MSSRKSIGHLASQARSAPPHMIEVTSGTIYAPFGTDPREQCAFLQSGEIEVIDGGFYDPPTTYALGANGIVVQDPDQTLQKFYQVIELPGEYARLHISPVDIAQAKAKLARG